MSENIKCVLSTTKEWFEKAVPEPALNNFNAQVGCHCEEVAEMLYVMNGADDNTNDLIVKATLAMDKLAIHLKHNSTLPLIVIEPDEEIDFLDALSDQIVTAVGVAHMQGYDIVGAMNEINESNFSKFEDGQPIFDDNRKIIKGKNYRKAKLEPFLKK